MTSSSSENRYGFAVSVSVSDRTLHVALADGRVVDVPLEWYPRLLHASVDERGNWRLIARSDGVHWPDLDEDLSVAGILAGRQSGESQSSLAKWLANRRQNSPSSGLA